MKHFILVAFLVTSAACGFTQDQQTSASLVQHYKVKGEVKEVDAEKKLVTIKHEEIPGFMAAMTMPFEVRDAALLTAVKKGDMVEADLAYTKQDAWLTSLKVTGKAPASAAPAAGAGGTTSTGAASTTAPGATTAGKALKPGDEVPDFTFTDQDGKQRKLSEFRGKAIAVTFIFTRCPMPTFCPKIAQNFLALQGELKKDASVYPKTQLLAVSIDPKYDKPAVTKAYLSGLKADQPHWSFATASENETRDFSRLFGFSYAGEELMISHNMRAAVINKEGKLVKVYNGSAWRPTEVASIMTTAAK